MPDHFHGIVWIKDAAGSDLKPNVGNGFNPYQVGNGLKPFPTKHGLPEIMRGFKTFSARRINEINANDKFQWQKSYYDHIIRNEESLRMVREYIQNNPLKWASDHDSNEEHHITQMVTDTGSGFRSQR